MRSWWMVDIARPDIRKMSRLLLRLACTYNVMDRRRRYELFDTFVPDTLERIICTYFVNWRKRFNGKIMEAGVDSSVILMSFVLQGMVYSRLAPSL